MALSSNSIIHFTKDLASLESILLETFKIRYCRETLYSRDHHFDILVPVVSFCDIPFSQILNHISSYGSYGIGLTKEWAERKGLNPVIYVEKNSTLGQNFFDRFFHKDLWGVKDIENFNLDNRKLFDLIRYMKNYQGDLYRINNKKPIKNYRFSDEREWRYVLPVENDHQMLVNCTDTATEAIKELKRVNNDKIIGERLRFGPDDISYIIIKNEKERNSVVSKILQIKEAHSADKLARLNSKILSVQQIKTDF
jgi:hypothetical protein